MPKITGVSVHRDDRSRLDIPIDDLAAAVQALMTVLAGQRSGGQYTYLNADECPVHGPWKAVPAGVSKNTGKSYHAFWTCDTEMGAARCTNKPAKEWVETHPPERNDASQASAPEPSGAPSAGEYDDLPF